MDPEVEALYSLPLDEFTKARDALAKARAKEQGKEAGAAVKALRKPSVAAWALNRLARSRPEGVEALLEAGDRLRRAQTAALEGGDPDELRDATKAEAAEVQTLAGQAASVLREVGRAASATQEERLVATLRAAAVDPVAGDLLRRGVLTAELSPAGFGFGVGEGDASDNSPLPDFRASTADSRPSTHESRKDERERAEARQKAKEQERAEREREQELRAARETAVRLEREAARAEELARKAREAADAAAARAEALAAGVKRAQE